MAQFHCRQAKYSKVIILLKDFPHDQQATRNQTQQEKKTFC